MDEPEEHLNPPAESNEHTGPIEAFYVALGEYVIEFSNLCETMQRSLESLIYKPGEEGQAGRLALEIALGEMTAAPLADTFFATVKELRPQLPEFETQLLRTLRKQVHTAIVQRNDLMHAGWRRPYEHVTTHRDYDENNVPIGGHTYVNRDWVWPARMTRTKASRSGNRVSAVDFDIPSIQAMTQSLADLPPTLDDIFGIIALERPITTYSPQAGFNTVVPIEDCYVHEAGRVTYTGPRAAQRPRHFSLR